MGQIYVQVTSLLGGSGVRSGALDSVLKTKVLIQKFLSPAGMKVESGTSRIIKKTPLFHLVPASVAAQIT